jgi:hypothetical protein
MSGVLAIPWTFNPQVRRRDSGLGSIRTFGKSQVTAVVEGVRRGHVPGRWTVSAGTRVLGCAREWRCVRWSPVSLGRRISDPRPVHWRGLPVVVVDAVPAVPEDGIYQDHGTRATTEQPRVSAGYRRCGRRAERSLPGLSWTPGPGHRERVGGLLHQTARPRRAAEFSAPTRSTSGVARSLPAQQRGRRHERFGRPANIRPGLP